MKRALILIVTAFLLSVPMATGAEERRPPFNPALYTKTTLPPGALYMESGKIHFIHEEGIVVGDATYPLEKNVQIFTESGLKRAPSDLKRGLTVDLYANKNHHAIYIVIQGR